MMLEICGMVYCVDLGESCPRSLSLRSSASTEPFEAGAGGANFPIVENEPIHEKMNRVSPLGIAHPRGAGGAAGGAAARLRWRKL